MSFLWHSWHLHLLGKPKPLAEVKLQPAHRGSFLLHRQAPCTHSCSCRSAGGFTLKHLGLAGGVHPAEALPSSSSAVVTEAMEEGRGEGQKHKPGKEK